MNFHPPANNLSNEFVLWNISSRSKNISHLGKVQLCKIFISMNLPPPPLSSPLLPSTKWIFFLYCEQKVGSALSLRSVWIIDMGFSSLYKSSILSEFRGGECGSSNIIFQYNSLYVPATALPFLFIICLIIGFSAGNDCLGGGIALRVK